MNPQLRKINKKTILATITTTCNAAGMVKGENDGPLFIIIVYNLVQVLDLSLTLMTQALVKAKFNF